MADPDPTDPLAYSQMATDYTGAVAPPHWSDVLSAPVPQLQPGLDIPTANLDAAIAAGNAPRTAPPDAQQVALGVDFPPSHWSMPTGAPDASQAGTSPVTPDISGFVSGLVPQSLKDNASAAVGAVRGALAPATVSDLTGEATIEKRDPLAPETPEEYAQRVARMDPQELAAEGIRHDDQQKAATATALYQKQTDDYNLAKTNYEARQKSDAAAWASSQQVQTDAMRLANSKIDPEAWMNSRSAPQKIAAGIAAILGGLAAPSNGGRNVGMDIINKAVEENIAAQKDNMANQWKGIDARRQGVSDLFAHNAQSFQSAETMRQATYEYAKNGLLAEQANYDPKGSTALRIANTVQQINAAQAKALQDHAQLQFKNALEYHTAVVNPAATQAETKRHNQVEEYNAAATRALTAADNVKRTPQQMADIYSGGDLSKVPPVPMSDKQFAAWSEIKSKQAEAATKGVTEQRAAAEESRKVTAGTIRDPRTGKALTITDENGKAIPLQTSETEAAPIKKTLTTAQNFMDAASQARRILDTDPSLVDRDTWQKLSTTLDNAAVAHLERHGEHASSKNIDIAKDALGPSFESFRSREFNKGKGKAALDSMIDTTKTEVANELTKVGYTGAVPLLDTSKISKPEDTEADTLGGAVNREQNANIATSVGSIFHPVDAFQNFSNLSPRDQVWMGQKNAPIGTGLADDAKELAQKQADAGDDTLQRAIKLDVLPSTVEAVDKLKAQAKGTNAKLRDEALSALLDASKKAPDDASQKLAADTLKQIADESIGEK